MVGSALSARRKAVCNAVCLNTQWGSLHAGLQGSVVAALNVKIYTIRGISLRTCANWQA